MRRHVASITEILVDDPALQWWERVEFHRLAESNGFVRRLVGPGTERSGAALAVAVCVDHHAHGRGAVGEHDPLRQMLNSFDRLSVSTDEEAEVVAGQPTVQNPLLFLYLDLDIETEPLNDLIEQLFERLRRL